ncbi:histidine phosphatase family protein [Streptomyces albidoflavus]|uniref:histidine phosphatase family protein n=1 Tax=Streptomyces TaxID=1883 RepID=UPI001E523663|nr:histidine phosphatase family protein [Streptomyces sp. OUCMDZ-3434]WSB21107.1 histidine phosphatase family protein [Streptomyces albidoflavus]
MTSTAATGMVSRTLYLARHGDASGGGGLSAQGRRQAAFLGERLRGVPLSAIHHGPQARTRETAEIVAAQRGDGEPAPSVCESAGDYVPYLPEHREVASGLPEATWEWLLRLPERERLPGPELARDALRRFTGAVPGSVARHELVVTHNFVIGWLVREALDAPDWRWIGLHHADAALSIIHYAPGRPSSLIVYNDIRHLPEELRWTGSPPGLRV